MNIFFVSSRENNKYKEELKCSFDKFGAQDALYKEINLTTKLLEQRVVNVVVNNGLAKKWYFALKGMGVVTITFGPQSEYEYLSDIVIDCFGEDKRKYFNSMEYSVCNSNNISVEGVFNIISKLEWDSSFFGFNISYISCLHLTDSVWRQAKKFIRDKNIKLVEYLCNCHDQRSVRAAELYGFNFVDIRITFEVNLLKETYKLDIDNNLRKAEVVNIDSLKNIARGSYKESRYFYDGNFDNNAIEEFYEGWVEKAVMGDFDDECWCLIEDEKPYAFCTVRYFSKEKAIIGLVGVSANCRGKGSGKKLILSVLKYLKDKGVRKVSVVTQGRNYPAQNLYITSGFRIKSTQLWYHKWM